MGSKLREIALLFVKKTLPLLQVLTIVFFVICETTWIAPFVLLYQAVQMFKNATLFVDNLKSKMISFIFGDDSNKNEAAVVADKPAVTTPVRAPAVIIEEVDTFKTPSPPSTPGRVTFQDCDTPPEAEDLTPRKLSNLI